MNLTTLTCFYQIIMKTSNKILESVSSVARNIPYSSKFRGIYLFFNRAMLKLGAESVVSAKMKDDTSMLVNLTTRTERGSYYTGKYDQDLIDIIHSLILPDSSFLDVGANIGFYSVSIANFFRSKKSNGKVIAFEPFDGNFQRLSENIKENKLDSYCDLNHFGLSNKPDKITITLREDFKSGSSTGNAAIPTSKEMDSNYKTSPITLKTLDDIWFKKYTNLGKIDIVKMDIEGHEDFCLEGGQKTINKHRPTILMEVSKPYYQSRNVKLDDTFFPLIPENYYIFQKSKKGWLRIDTLEKCSRIDNVFLVPTEKLDLKAYQIFIN